MTQELVQAIADGLRLGLVIGISGLGLSLIFGTMGLVNFAHGEFLAFGAVTAYVAGFTLGFESIIVAGVVGVAAGALLGGALEYAVWRPARRLHTNLLQMLVVSIGVSIVLRYALFIWFGGETKPFGALAIQEQWHFLGISMAPREVWVSVISLLAFVALYLFLKHTPLGLQMRAVADSPELARASAVRSGRVLLAVWVLAGALGGLGGVLLGVSEQVNWLMGYRLILLIFAGVILGGLGSVWGSVWGCLCVGVVVEVSASYLGSDLKYITAFVAMILVLMVKPTGLFARAERIG